MKCTRISELQSKPLLPEFVFDLQRFDGEKTEEPTSKKREDARKKGQVARSQELNTAFVLIMGFLILRILWEYIYGNIAEYTVYLYSHISQSTSTESITELFIGIMLLLAKTVMPVMFAILIIGLAINIFQACGMGSNCRGDNFIWRRTHRHWRSRGKRHKSFRH